LHPPGFFLEEPGNEYHRRFDARSPAFAAQGAKAIAEAAHKAESCRQAGDAEQAKIWERGEGALRELRGPSQT